MGPSTIVMTRPHLGPRLEIYPELNVDLEISRVENEFKNTSMTVSRVFVTYIGHENDEILPVKFPLKVSGSSAPKFVLLVNPVHHSVDTSETIFRQIIVTVLGDFEPVFVNINGCSETEKKWVMEQIPHDSGGSCTLY